MNEAGQELAARLISYLSEVESLKNNHRLPFIRLLRISSHKSTALAAIKELEKIEMTRQTDNIHRLDHAVTAKQNIDMMLRQQH